MVYLLFNGLPGFALRNSEFLETLVESFLKMDVVSKLRLNL